MPINNQLSGSASPVELVTHAKTLGASRESFSLLTINGGSSSIKFALYRTGEPPERVMYGKVDRIGLPGTNLTFNDPTGNLEDRLGIDTHDRRRRQIS